MAQYLRAVKRHQQVVFVIDAVVGAQWLPPLPLFDLSIRGELRHVKCRLDVPAPGNGTIDLYIADKSLSPMASTPKDEDVFYANIGAALTASPTASSIADNLAAVGGAVYEVAPIAPEDTGVDSNLAVGGLFTATVAGVHTILVDVWAEVQL
jgi:hypothetical protein